jgi:transcription elongation factor SPT6
MKMYYKHGFEPSLLEERFITPADDKIRETDIPERLQLRRDAERILSAPSEEELAAEASWIGSQIKQSSDKYYAPEEVAVKVLNVLRLLLVDKFEIPFIDMYRKEHWHPELRKPDLWQIYDLDEMWAYFQRRKRDYMRCLNAMSAPDSELERIIQNVAVEEELNDLREHFTLHDDSGSYYWLAIVLDGMTNASFTSASRATSGGSKRPERRDDYSVAKKALLGKLADNFGLSVVQIAKNVFAEYAQEIANDEEKTPEEVAESFVVPEFPTEERALEGARLVLAKNIAFHPSIRKYLREKLVPTCSVTTHPTDRGLEEVDEFHAVWVRNYWLK